MFLITNKIGDFILNWDEEEAYTDVGYPLVSSQNIAYPADSVKTYIVEYVPSEVVPGKYCYTTEDGFYIDPNYVEPNKYGISDELLQQIKDDTIAEVEEAVLNGTDE